MEKLNKKVRIQLTLLEVRILRNMLAQEYHRERRNLRWTKKRIAQGEPADRLYTIAHREKHLKFDKHLLKKLSRHAGIKWFEQ